MSRLIRRRIAISQWAGPDPLSFQDGAVSHRIEQYIDRWVEMGDWWQGEGTRRLLRVLTEAQQVFDLEQQGDSWYIYKVWD